MSGSYLAARLQLEDEILNDPRLTPFTRTVGVKLARCRHAETGQCNISISALATKLNCGTRTVDRALAALVRAEWIVRTSGKGRSVNSYVIPRLDAPGHHAAPGAADSASSRQNGATTNIENAPRSELSSRQSDATNGDLSRHFGAMAKPLSRHFDRVVAPKTTSLSRQNGAQSLLGISLKDLGCPKPAKPVRTQNAYSAEFEKFWSAYPTDKLMSKSETWKVWSKLTKEDRASAIAAIPGFVAHCRKDPTYRAVHAVRFLSQRRFDGFVPTHAEGTAASAADPPIEFPGGFKRPTSYVRKAVVRFAKDPNSWPSFLGPPPDRLGCLVPKHLLVQEPVGA